MLGTIFLRTVIDGVAKVIKTGSKVYEGLIVGVVVVFAVALSQTSKLRGREGFFAGPLGFVAAINLSLFAGVIAVLIGPTLAEGKTALNGPVLGAWTACSLFALLLFVRTQLQGNRRRLGAVVLGFAVLATYFALDRGLPTYQLRVARAAIEKAGGKIATQPNGDVRVDFSGSRLDDATLAQLADNFLSLHTTELSLAGTNVSDDGIDSLGKLTTLKQLDLTGTKVTRSGTRALGRALPDVDVTQ